MTHKYCNFASKFEIIKRLRHIFAVLAWAILSVYVIIVALLHITAVQRIVASEASHVLSQKLGTKVEIGNVNLGLLNRAILDDVLIEDQQQRQMLTCHRLSAKIEILPLLKGKISISSAQIFGMKAMLVKADAFSPLNCQFVIDSLASKDTTSHTPLDLHISSLVMRNTTVSYDRLDQPRRLAGIDVNHLSLNKVSSHIMLYALTDDSLSVNLKRLSLAEANSGFVLNNLTFEAMVGKNSAEIRDFNLITDNSDISIIANASMRDKVVRQFSLQSRHSSIGIKDVACFVPQLASLPNTLFLDADISGTDKSLNVRNITVKASNKELEVSLAGKAATSTLLIDAFKHPETVTWDATINRLATNGTFINNILSAVGQGSDVVSRIGLIDYTLNANGANGNMVAKGNLSTSVGKIMHDMVLRDRHLRGQINTDVMNLGYLLGTDAIGDTHIIIDADADITSDAKVPLSSVGLNVTAPLLTLKGYPYRNVNARITQKADNIEATVSIADYNVNAAVSLMAENVKALYGGKVEALRNFSTNVELSGFNPYALGLANKWQSATFSLNANAKVATLQNVLEHIEAEVTDLTMTAPDESFECERIFLYASESPDRYKEITLNSSFADIHASGNFNIATLPQSLTNLVAQKLPTLPGIAQYKSMDNDIALNATVYNTNFLRKILGIDIDAKEQIDINVMVNDKLGKADLTLSAPSMQCFGMDFTDTRLSATCPGDTLVLNLYSAKKNYDGTDLNFMLRGKAANNVLSTSLGWQNGDNNTFRGSLNAMSRFFLNDNNDATIAVNIQPSEVFISDTLWNLHPSTISYSANRLRVNNFLIENPRQHIHINGVATKSAEDSIVVNLQDVNVAYIMNLVDFHDVEFSGLASGNAVGKALFSNPEAYADLDVRRFLFENGRLGTLTAHGQWDNDLGQINIDAQCIDENVAPDKVGFVKVDGYISLKRQYIDLGIKADNVRLEFVHTYTDSFLDNIEACATGGVRIFGPLKEINMTGEAFANGSVSIIPLNTTYTIRDAYVEMVPNEIKFVHDSIYDKHGNVGIVDGALHHKNLGKMTFDLNIAAKHLLCFDFPELNGSTFCGHVVGTGSCKITGRPGEVTFDIDAYPEATSYLTYNASSPDALQKQEFITWRDKTEYTDTGDITVRTQSGNTYVQPLGNIATNVRLNFLVHATPDATLRLLMDQRTGDYINLNGNGTLRATYYNKGGMQIFGNYLVERGEYKMTIQQVITKNFEFLPGGTIAFGGDPYQAAIDLKAQYVVPSAPLADLNIGNSFSSSTVRVNCLMNISGTAEQPAVEFDLNLPQASADIQQMITSLMDSEEARNQQVVYLLAIGRFYSANNTSNVDATRSQASLAMQSFLSGTVSQQLNNLISNVIIKDNNWNFGANISPGDEGMMNAEYEGLVSGRMLNNRLLINGQFGYRDNVNATTSFIGDFDVRYLLFPNGNLQVKVYNQTSDRYFTKSNLNTQGLGIILKHDFNTFLPKRWFTTKNKK